MPFDEEEKDFPLSTRKALERGDHGKADRRDQMKKEKQGLQQLKLNVLKQNVQQGKTKTPDSKADEGKKAETVKTKSREEEVKQAVVNVETKTSPEDLIHEQQRKEAAQKQTGYEQAQSNLG